MTFELFLFALLFVNVILSLNLLPEFSIPDISKYTFKSSFSPPLPPPPESASHFRSHSLSPSTLLEEVLDGGRNYGDDSRNCSSEPITCKTRLQTQSRPGQQQQQQQQHQRKPLQRRRLNIPNENDDVEDSPAESRPISAERVAPRVGVEEGGTRLEEDETSRIHHEIQSSGKWPMVMNKSWLTVLFHGCLNVLMGG